MKVYIAAPYPYREQAIRVMRMLETQGIDVTSRWLKAPDTMTDEHARKDLEDVARADVLLALNPDGWEEKGTGGRHVEFGYALALGKAIVLVGERSNIFHHLAHVRRIDSGQDVTKNVQRAERELLTRDSVVAHVLNEFSRAEAKHKPMNSPHEGYSVILEELDELWAHVKADTGRTPEALKEAVQVAAMGIRYVRDLAPACAITSVVGGHQ
jgi:nucleoside 2-deoxyribosyltransferase